MSRKYWFTSDQHYSHKNVIKFCKRPFMQFLDERSRKIVDECWAREVTSIAAMALELKLPEPVVESMKHTAIDLMKEKMNETMIDRYNAVVDPNDVVYFLGDVAFEKDRTKLENILRRLNGEKHIIWGNHDNILKSIKWRDYFKTASDLRMITVPAESNNGRAQDIVLCHYAMRVWDKSHYGTWMLHGHSHHTLPDDPHSLSLDVGVDGWNFTPVSMEQLNEKMSKKLWKPRDHHGKDDS